MKNGLRIILAISTFLRGKFFKSIVPPPTPLSFWNNPLSLNLLYEWIKLYCIKVLLKPPIEIKQKSHALKCILATADAFLEEWGLYRVKMQLFNLSWKLHSSKLRQRVKKHVLFLLSFSWERQRLASTRREIDEVGVNYSFLCLWRQDASFWGQGPERSRTSPWALTRTWKSVHACRKLFLPDSRVCYLLVLIFCR